MTQVINAVDIPQNETPFIIDVRTQDEFMREHIAGSHNIPLDELPNQLSQLAQRVDGQGKIIISCQSGKRATHACTQLEGQGLAEKVFLLEGGLTGWKAAQRPTVVLKKGISIMRQVQIIVGVMVLSGVFYQPLWWLAPLAGAGMLLAGMTNTCMMAVVLGKLPWNKLPDSTTQQCSID